ncbi:MAG: hypothetical protein OHK0045_02970 [Raineya sp.]
MGADDRLVEGVLNKVVKMCNWYDFDLIYGKVQYPDGSIFGPESESILPQSNKFSLKKNKVLNYDSCQVKWWFRQSDVSICFC